MSERGRILIRNESDLFDAIERLREGEMPDELRFEGWPRFEVTIRGEDFDGGVPTRVMPSLLGFQAAVNRAYARSLGREKLTPEERRRAELVVRLEPGSTTFVSDLTPVLNHAVTTAIKNMSGVEILLGVLGVAVVIGTTLALKARLRHRAQVHKLDLRLRLSEQETKRLGIVADLARRNSNVQSTIDDAGAARDRMLRSLEDGDELVEDGEPLVRGDMARRLARPSPPERVQGRLDGDFLILSVDSGRIEGGFRVRVRNVKSGDEIAVNIPEGTLGAGQIETLQIGEWGKAPLHMRLNVVRVGERIAEATLIEAGLLRSD